ncbi:uncharacterized protein (DUF1697 family) [Homoserinimonas aerilata]|uniref:Uncharacterized protein (DUF1697 family) n=1 Tax=Homoserinimonas aerilata TaxID=1162970 RepID=A0A542YG70_9MICO|nr:DUF1697 domain-containing protein [Homoserinimonas aerilata]TQL47090.1 uncharacterized protein (DUF1697 family) [Homoserinimonas aerilata]
MSDKRIILIRAVNVGGTAKLPMAELRALAEELGATQVATYIASGNLLCAVPGHPDAFDRALEEGIRQRFGFFREVMSRSRDELVAALEGYPFEVVEERFSYVNFLVGEPTPDAIARARLVPCGADQWQLAGREQFIQYADGAGRAQLNSAALAKALGVAGTARNLATVRKLIALAA